MRLRLTLPCALALTACNAFSSPPTDADDPGTNQDFRSRAPAPSFSSGMGFVGAAGGSAGFGNVAFGPVQVSAVPPAPIQGGTLLVARDGHTAIAADPDRDRVVIADLQDGEVLATLELQEGDEPGRLVEDLNGRVHIVLRRAGMIATLDIATRALIDRRGACLAPQGIAYSQATDALLVACAEGNLVELPAAGGSPTRSVRVDSDLRDVMVVGSRVLVSRFKSAELLELDAGLQIMRRTHATDIAGPFAAPFAMAPLPPSDQAVKSFSAEVAFRTLADASGRVLMLHQRAQSTEIALQEAGEVHTDSGEAGAGGDAGSGGMDLVPTPVEDSAAGGDSYGGGDMCSSIVRPALSMDGPNGLVSGPVLPAATLAVDAAFSPDGRWIAVGIAGSPDVSQKTFGMLSQLSALVMPVESVTATATAEGEPGSCSFPGIDTNGAALSTGQVVAVAFDAQNRLVMQTREPSALHIMANIDGCIGCSADVVIPFGGESRRDTGHDLFHGDAGAGIACASCHPGGAEDGHTWLFSELGPRRTQLFNMGIKDTLPLHWDGELATFSDLVSEVFMRRMGGADLTVSQVQAMGDWIETLEPGVPLRAAEDPAVLRGKALFESTDVACASCHTGPMLTNNQTVDVGTGGAFQVPSLIGVAHHAPFIHSGCAQTLRDRFDPTCGGATHGKTDQLGDGEIDDLVAYLESL